MKTCDDVRLLYQEASCCDGNPDGLVDLGVASDCKWEEHQIKTTLPEHVLNRPGTSHTLEDGRTIYLQSLIGLDNAPHGLVVAWDWTQPNSLLWVSNVTSKLLVDIPYFQLESQEYYYWSHSNSQTPYVWNNTVYTMSSNFPFSQQWVASLDLYTGRVLKVSASWKPDAFLATRSAAHVIESVSGEATLVLPAVTLNYQIVNSPWDETAPPIYALTQDLSDKRYMHSYGIETNEMVAMMQGMQAAPKVELQDTGCGILLGLDPVTLERKWTRQTCAQAFKVGDTIGPDAFAPGTEYHVVEVPIKAGYVFSTTPHSTTVFKQSMWHTRELKYVDVEITEGFVWPANGTKVATVNDGEVDVTHLRKWIIKHLKLGYTFPHTEEGAIEAAWMSEAGGSFWRSNAINIPYKGETVAVFTSGNGVNVPEATSNLYREHCETMPNSLERFVWAGPYFESAKEHFVDQVKCRLNVWKTMTSERERRNYNNAQIGVYANGTVAFVAKDEAYDAWSGGMDPGKTVAGNADGSWPRIRDSIDCDPIPAHYFEDGSVPYLIWGSKCGIRHKFNLNTLTSEIITMEGWPGRTGGNHFSDVMVQKPGRDPILVSIYENHQSANQIELGSARWTEWTNLTISREPPRKTWTVRGNQTFNSLPDWEGFKGKYMVGVDPKTLERKWVTEIPYPTYGDTTFLQAKSDALGVVPIRMADDITRVVDAYSGTVVYEQNSGVGSYAGWVNVNSHLFVSTFGRFNQYSYNVNTSSSLHLLHYKCDGDDALGAIHQKMERRLSPTPVDRLSKIFHKVMERSPTTSEYANVLSSWIGLPVTMARAAIVDRAGYAAERLNLDRHIDLTGKTYLMVGASTGQGFQTGLVLASMGATVHLLARTESVYLMSVLSAMSDVKDAASYPFYSGMRNVPEETINRMHFHAADVRDYQSYKAAVLATRTNGTFDGVLISAGSFKVLNDEDKEYANQMGFSSSLQEEITSFPSRYQGASLDSQYPVQVASTRFTAILLKEGVLKAKAMTIIASTASIFEMLLGLNVVTTFGYVPYTFAKAEQAESAPLYLREQGVENIRVVEPGGVFTGINLAYQMTKLLDLANASLVPDACKHHHFTTETAQYALGVWDTLPALFGAFDANLKPWMRDHAKSFSEDGCVAYFDNFGVASILSGNGMTTEIELALQIVRGFVYPAVGKTVHWRDGAEFVDKSPEDAVSAYEDQKDPIAKAVLAADMGKERFLGMNAHSSDRKQELFKN